MKPSERIKEIADKYGIYHTPDKIFLALFQYLDEEWEKKQPLEIFCPNCKGKNTCCCV